MERFVVGITTQTCYELLERCLGSLLAGTAVPAQILVIDNGGGFQSYRPDVVVEQPGRNVGVAACWNLLMKRAQPTPIMLCADRVEVGPSCCEQLLASPADCALADGFACFRLEHETFNAVGPFDEMFWSLDLAALDYFRRLRLAGKSLGRAAEGNLRSRCAFSSGERPDVKDRLQRSRDHYLRKWGGLPGRETFGRPFEGSAPHAELPNGGHTRESNPPQMDHSPRLVVPANGITPETRLRCSYGQVGATTTQRPESLDCVHHGQDLRARGDRLRTRDCALG